MFFHTHYQKRVTFCFGTIDIFPPDANLDALSDGLGMLKLQSLMFSETLDEHNSMIERIQTKVDARDATLKDQDGKIRKILKWSREDQEDIEVK